MCAGQHGECLGIELCFTGVRDNFCWFKPMATGVFGYVRGHGLHGYGNANRLYCEMTSL